MDLELTSNMIELIVVDMDINGKRPVQIVDMESPDQGVGLGAHDIQARLNNRRSHAQRKPIVVPSLKGKKANLSTDLGQRIWGEIRLGLGRHQYPRKRCSRLSDGFRPGRYRVQIDRRTVEGTALGIMVVEIFRQILCSCLMVWTARNQGEGG